MISNAPSLESHPVVLQDRGGGAGVAGMGAGVELHVHKAPVYLRIEARDCADLEAALLDQLRQLGREHARAALLAIGEGGLELVVRALIQRGDLGREWKQKARC